jgi:hypothetical protein
VLLHNDLVKRSALATYVEYAQKREGRRCIAVCSPGQEVDIPGLEIVYDEPPGQNG